MKTGHETTSNFGSIQPTFPLVRCEPHQVHEQRAVHTLKRRGQDITDAVWEQQAGQGGHDWG